MVQFLIGFVAGILAGGTGTYLWASKVIAEYKKVAATAGNVVGAVKKTI